MRVSPFGKVNHKKWDGRDNWDRQLVSPSDVEDII